MNNIRLQLENLETVASGLWTIGQLFQDEDFQYISNKIETSPNESYVVSPASALRYEMTWTTDGILEELHNSFQKLNSFISDTISTKVEFNQVRVWRDLPGYRIPFHEDDRQVEGHIQIYVKSNQSDCGTTWYTSNGRKTLPFKPNTGYLTVCRYLYPHGMLVPVSNENRYSIYATFRRKS